MAPTTTAFTVFKATLSTKPKQLINKNKNDDERKASVDTATSPGAPQATASSVEAERENTRPSPPGISAEGTGLPSQDKDRDARAYERERQRAKHAGEWAKRRARKAGQGTVGGTGASRADAAHAGRRANKSRKVGVDVDVDVDVYAVTPHGRDAGRTTDGLGAGLLKRVFQPPSGNGGTDPSKAIPGVKVDLSEIMVLSQKKLRKINVDDFEVIPHIRSVIALDDVANVHEMDLIEPWEHIYANSGEGKAPDSKFGRPSYARVAGTGCQ